MVKYEGAFGIDWEAIMESTIWTWLMDDVVEVEVQSGKYNFVYYVPRYRHTGLSCGGVADWRLL